MTEPAVWVPNAARHIRSATAAADPELEPPGVCALFHGLVVGPASPMAKAVVTVLPVTIAPAALSCATDVASLLATRNG